MAETKKEEFEKLPEKKIGDKNDKLKQKDKIELVIEEIKNKFGIDVEPVKNNKYKKKKVINYLLEHYDFRYNLFAKKPEYKRKNEKEYQYFDERDLDNTFNELELEGPASLAIGNLLSLIGSKYISPDYDPILEYLFQLPKWDNKDRFPFFCTQIKLRNETAENRELLNKYFKKWFVTLVGALITTDIKNETCLVFTGAEGVGKTRFFTSLVPRALRLKYFWSGAFDTHNKDHYEMLGTKILIFLDEMATLTRTDAESLKATMSQGQIVLRRAYGRGNIHVYRRASFCGAINDDKFLTDQGANRRWLPFAVEKVDIDDEFDIGLLYAQAFTLFKDGFNLWYDLEEIKQLRERNEEFRRRPPEEELIMLHWTVPTQGELNENKFLEYLTPTDVMYKLSSMDAYKKMNTNDSVLKRIGKTLQSLGFPSTKKRLPYYTTPRDCYIMKPVDSFTIDAIKKSGEEMQQDIF